MTGEGLTVADFWNLFGPSILASLVAAALCGYLGFFVVLRRVAFVSAALGQISGLGVSLGFLVGAYAGIDPHDRTPLYLDPVVWAMVLTAVAAILLASVSRVQQTSSESAVAFVYLSSAALVLLVLSMPQIVQEAHEVENLLFGNAVAVRREHLAELIAVAVIVLCTHLVLYKDLLFVSFDREMARTLGLPVARLELWLHVSIGAAVATATRATGALPVFGFLVLPAGAALLAAGSTRAVLALSIGGAVLAAAAGFWLSYVENWPTGPMMVIAAAAYWPLGAAVRWLRLRR